MPLPPGRTFIIAEAGVNHNGRPDLARRLVAMAAAAGADAVKFQTFKAHECAGRFAEPASYQKENTGSSASQLEMLRRLELPFPRFRELHQYARRLGITFLSTPDGPASLAFLVRLGVPFLKIGSTEITNPAFLQEIGATGLPLLLSTGMAALGEVETAVATLEATGNHDLTLMHCTTDYPTPPEDVNLRAMVTLAAAFQHPVGLSDHTLGNEAAVAAVALGAVVIEKHITLDRSLPGPDHAASMPPDEFAAFVKAIRRTERLLGTGIKAPSSREREIMREVRRSIVAARPLAEGTVLREADLAGKRPGTGISPTLLPFVVGRRLRRSLQADEPVRWEDLGGCVAARPRRPSRRGRAEP